MLPLVSRLKMIGMSLDVVHGQVQKANKNILMSPTGFIIIPLQYLWRRFLLSVRNKSQGVLCSARNGLACVASVSVWFRSRERPKNGIFGFGRGRNGTRANKLKRGRGREGRKQGFLPFFSTPFPLFYSHGL